VPALCGAGAARVAPTLLDPVEPAGPAFWSWVEDPASAPPVVAPVAPDDGAGEVKFDPTLLDPVEPDWAEAANGNISDALTIKAAAKFFIVISILVIGTTRKLRGKNTTRD
jgi:hypothetical protein